MKTVNLSVPRNDSLDYLRGLAAVGVMAYHLYLFTYGECNASDFLAKVKIYAVAIFYVLSGLTLCIAHAKSYELNKQNLAIFYLKRFFRIFPLLWLATLFTYLLRSVPNMYSLKYLVVNIAILPGALRPDGFITDGAWSIGNELFFYACFPFIYFFSRTNKRWFFITLVIITLPFLYFTFRKLDPSVNLGYQWTNYVNPLNQFFYFAAGMLIASLPKPGSWLVKQAPWLMVLLFLGTVYYPAHGEPIVLVTGFTRMILSVFIIMICFLFYVSDFSFLPLLIKRVLKYLGDASYSVYLSHPLVYIIVKQLSDKYFQLPAYMIIMTTVVFTLLISNLIYVYFEKYFIRLGKKIITDKIYKMAVVR
jgi:peptidoglycan/LPS O-acetylase OafA/YrhL